MIAKKVYTESSSYFGGKNPLDDTSSTIIEFNGNYYKIFKWCNHTNAGQTIEKIDFDPEKIPEEYDTVEEGTTLRNSGYNKQLIHGNYKEININLADFDTEYEGKKIPEDLRETYREELRSLAHQKIAKNIEEDPSLDYRANMESADLTDEQRQVAELIISRIEKEMSQDKYLELQYYRPVIENIVSIAKGESIIVTHENSSYSRPYDTLIKMSDLVREDERSIPRLATSGLHWEHAWGDRDTKPDVFSLQGKRISLGNGKTYLGSYNKEGYTIDVMLDEKGQPYIHRNIYIQWNNTQYFSGVIDESFPVQKFDIRTGTEGELKQYNEQLAQQKAEKREFYETVIEQAQKQFGLSPEQTRQMLDYAGTVTALSMATSFAQDGLSMIQALEILKQPNYEERKSAFEKAGLEYPAKGYFIVERALDTFLLINEKLGKTTNNGLEYSIGDKFDLNKLVEEAIKDRKTGDIEEVQGEYTGYQKGKNKEENDKNRGG